MNNVMLLAVTTGDLGGAFSAERMAYALEMTALGLLAVFSVLAILWGVLALFKVIFYDSKQKKEKAPTEEKTVVTETVVPAPVASQNDDETVAVIMAAISAYIVADPALAEEYAGGFRVVSFKRVRDKAAWNKK